MSISIKRKIVNIHIPKTAGTSFRALVQPRLRQQFIGVHTKGGVDDYYGELQRIARKRYPEMGDSELSFMSGHYRFRDIWKALGQYSNEISFVTFIRDPVARTISDYYYCTSEAHPPHKKFIAQYPTFDKYLQGPGQMSKQLIYLSPSQTQDPDEIYDNVMRNFDFVGLTEKFDTHADVFMGKIGFAGVEKARENVGPKSDRTRDSFEVYKDRLSEILKDEIDLYNRLAANWDNNSYE